MGGKKPRGVEPTRGNCRSRRGRHDSRQTLDAPIVCEAKEFSLFSSSWNLGTEYAKENLTEVTEPTEIKTLYPLDYESPSNDFKTLSNRLDHVIDALINLGFNISQFSDPDATVLSKTKHADKKSELSNVFIKPSDTSSLASSADAALLNRLLDRLSTLEGRQSAVQSKVAQLDIAFGGTSHAVWQRAAKKLENIMKSGDAPVTELGAELPATTTVSISSTGQGVAIAKGATTTTTMLSTQKKANKGKHKHNKNNYHNLQDHVQDCGGEYFSVGPVPVAMYSYPYSPPQQYPPMMPMPISMMANPHNYMAPSQHYQQANIDPAYHQHQQYLMQQYLAALNTCSQQHQDSYSMQPTQLRSCSIDPQMGDRQDDESSDTEISA